jgi:hypothetical protein
MTFTGGVPPRSPSICFLPRERLCFVNPAHDGIMVPRKLIIGITSKVQPSGCKREYLIEQLAKKLSPDDFMFKIMGFGWDSIVEEMRRRGITVEYWRDFDYEEYRRLMPTLDYYLYVGQDEGSMGFVDALAAGVATIVTPQGFHLDAKDGITYSFNEFDELATIFDAISESRRCRVRAVEQWTWAEYARRHARIWEYLLRRKSGQPIPELWRPELAEVGIVEMPDKPSVILRRRVSSRLRRLRHKVSSRLHRWRVSR